MKQTIKLFFHAQWNPYSKTHTFDHTYNIDMSEYGYVLLESREVEIEVPPIGQLVKMTVDALKLKLNKMRSDHHTLQQGAVQEIEQLLCLEAPREEVPMTIEVEAIRQESNDDIPF